MKKLFNQLVAALGKLVPRRHETCTAPAHAAVETRQDRPVEAASPRTDGRTSPPVEQPQKPTTEDAIPQADVRICPLVEQPQRGITREEAVADALRRQEDIDNAYLYLGTGDEASARALCLKNFPSFSEARWCRVPAKVLVTCAYLKLSGRFEELGMTAQAEFCKSRTINNLAEFGPVK